MLHSALARGILGYGLAIAAGFGLGVAAWGEGRAPHLAVALPFAIALCHSRGQAFLLGLAYTAGLLRYTAAFIGSWFDGSVAIGLFAVAAYAVVSGAVWAIGWSRSPNPRIKGAAVSLAWLVALLPPAAVVVPGHPLLGAAHLLPGWGWAGVAASAVVPAAVVWASVRYAWPRRVVLVGCSLLLLSLGIAGLTATGARSAEFSGIKAISTAWGRLDDQEATLLRIAEMGRLEQVLADGHEKAVIWPESIVGRYEPSLYPVLKMEVLQPARRAGRSHVVGMDVPLPDGKLLNSAVAFYPDGSSATATARQPAPVALWRPWADSATFVANWTAHNILNLSQEHRAAVIFCYEEYIPVLYLVNEALDRPTVYLAMSNTWAAREPTADAIQAQHSLGMANLFGRPYFRAVNRAQP